MTVVVKATLAYGHRRAMALAGPVAVRRTDELAADTQAETLLAPSELAPYLPQAEVLFVGDAHVEPGHDATAARLAVYRDVPLVDKTLHAYTATDGPRTVPIDYRQTAYDPRLNPVGRLDREGTKPPQLRDPNDPTRPVGLGPVAPRWPARAELLGAEPHSVLDPAHLDLPAGFDWSFWQAAPADQRCPYLVGDEWILLDGLDADHSRVRFRLPSPRAHARVALGSSVRPLELVADTLHIDGRRRECTLLWRGSFAVSDPAEVAELRIWAGVELPGDEVRWPADAGMDRQVHAVAATEQTVALDEQAMRRAGPQAATPFAQGPSAAPPAALDVDDGPAGETVALSERGLGLAAKLPHTPFESPPVLDGEGRVEAAPDPTDQAGDFCAEDTVALSHRTLATAGLGLSEAPYPLAAHGDSNAPAALHPAPIPGAPWAAPTQQAARPLRGDGQVTLALGDLLADEEGSSSWHTADETTLSVADALTPAAPAAPSQETAPQPPDEAPPTAGLPAPTPVGEIELPRRRTDAIPFIGRPAFAGAAIPWQLRPPHPSLTVVVKATFDLEPGGPARLRARSDPPTGEVASSPADEVVVDASVLAKPPRYPSDLALFKPRADVVLAGHAHAADATACVTQVAFGFGHHGNRFERVLDVIGPRTWRQTAAGLVPSDPRPLGQPVALQYENAYGGAGHAENPVGQGHARGEGAELPLLEDPRHLLRSPHDRPHPICFAPIPMVWGARWGKLGTYDRHWLESRWPYFPDDFDWSFFQAAPLEQQLDFLQGDEPFEIAGVLPEGRTLRGNLPSLRPRCVAVEAPNMDRDELRSRSVDVRLGQAVVREVLLRLDTAVLDADELRLDLVWRGVLEVDDPATPELRAFFISSEPLADEPATLAEIAGRLAAELAPEPVALADESAAKPANGEAAAPPSTEPKQAQEDAAGGAPDDGEDILRDLEAQVAQLHQQQDAAIAGAAAPPAPDFAATLAALRAGGASDDQVAALDAMVQEVQEPDVASPPVEPPGQTEDGETRQRVIERLQTDQPLDGLDLKGADLSDLDFNERSLRGVAFSGARLRRCCFDGADLAEAVLAGADLTDASLVGAKLERSDLSKASLRGADLGAADLGDADLSGCHAPGASFERSRGEHARFVEGTFAEASFREAKLTNADFSRATLDAATFEQAELPRVRLYDVRGVGACSDAATLADARADGAQLTGSSFQKAIAPGSIWERARLDESTFHSAALTNASFVGARCQRVIFSVADVSRGRLSGARLAGSSLLKTNLMMASLDAADLSGADLRGANLHGAATWQANLEGADLDLAIVTKTQIEGAS